MTDYQVATERVVADRPETALPVGCAGAMIDPLASITDAQVLMRAGA